jgi:hypothetical protein
MALAFAALRSSEYTQDSAAMEIASIMADTERRTAQMAKGTAVRAIRFPLGRTNRAIRKFRMGSAYHDQNEARAMSIRTQVLRFIRNTPSFQKQFTGWFAAFQMHFARTPEWLQRQEQPYRERLRAAENALRERLGREPEPHDYDFWAINCTGCLAELLHELGRFEEARPYYELAITRLCAATMPMLPGYRENTLQQLTCEMGDCLDHRPSC